ncbi:hypothetical protein AB0F11_22050 [Streptomyces sp. NPDC032472]|uniref:hypothetical protein n=1 Tax=Streptomyces sp. NPDC032472 TaxID=3155018 RepID=UPI00340EF3E1
MEHEQTAADLREEPGPTPAPAPEPAAQPSAQPTAPRRGPGRRSVAVIAAGAALGVLAGTVTGYAIQYGRKPTPLPPLEQRPARPAAQLSNDSTSLRSINANRWHKTDEDLTKLLVPAPGGAKVEFNGVQSPDAFAADYFEKPVEGLGSIIRDGVRRIATVRWSEGDRDFVEIRLLQFHDRAGAVSFQKSHGYMAGKDYAGNLGKDLPGAPAEFGHLWVDSEAHADPGHFPLKSARAIARRGDVVMDVTYVNNRGDIDEGDIVDLAKRQLERL